jgi:hypothetical protein
LEAGQIQPGDSVMSDERRETERAILYWEQRAAEYGCNRLTLSAFELDEMLSDQGNNRFIIAVDRVVDNYVLLTYGERFARLLGVAANSAADFQLVHQVPARFLPAFIEGCRDATPHGAPVRIEGRLRRRGGRRELYRAVFMPLGAKLVFGAFNSRVIRVATRPSAVEQMAASDEFLEHTAAKPLMPRDEYEAAVAAFMRVKGITRCPTAYAVPTHASLTAADQTALGRYAAKQELLRREKATPARRSFWIFRVPSSE